MISYKGFMCLDVIDMSDNYSKVESGFINKVGSQLEITWKSKDSTKIESINLTTKKYFPNIFNKRIYLTGNAFKKVRICYDSIWLDLKNEIYNGKAHKIKLQKLKKFIKDKCKFSDEIIEGIIKLEIANNYLLYSKFEVNEYIYLGARVKYIEDKRRYLGSIASELGSISKRIDLIVSHQQTKGNYKEYLLRNILKKYIPRKFEVATGFIDGYSKQCDIIIFDSENYAPLFRDYEIVVVPPSSVRAVIEVKSNLTSDELKDSIESIASISKNNITPLPFFKGVFAFRSSTYASVSKVCKRIRDVYISSPDSNAKNLFEAVTSVCVLDKFNIVIDHVGYPIHANNFAPKIYSLSSIDPDINLGASLFFDNLFDYLNVSVDAHKTNLSYFRDIRAITNYKFERYLFDRYWSPEQLFNKPTPFSKEDIEKRIEIVYNFFNGNFTIEDLIKTEYSDIIKYLEL